MSDQIKMSMCCNVPCATGGVGDFDDRDEVVTVYYVCTKCQKPCDFYET